MCWFLLELFELFKFTLRCRLAISWWRIESSLTLNVWMQVEWLWGRKCKWLQFLLWHLGSGYLPSFGHLSCQFSLLCPLSLSPYTYKSFTRYLLFTFLSIIEKTFYFLLSLIKIGIKENKLFFNENPFWPAGEKIKTESAIIYKYKLWFLRAWIRFYN